MNIPARYLMVIIVALVATGSWTALARDDGAFDDNRSGEDQSAGASLEATESGSKSEAADEPYVPKTKRELQRILNRLQFDVTQNEATEPAFRNLYWNNKKEGIYKCIVCGYDLFSSKTKYESGTGWPSFFAPIESKHVGTRTDYRLFVARTEVHCARCNAHLGHVFDDGPQPTGLRYCMNSASLRFVEKSESPENQPQENKSPKDKSSKDKSSE